MRSLKYKARLHWLGMAVVTVVAFGLVVAFFPGVIRHPDDYFFLNAGDGLKAYFATTYYVRHDAGLHFTGMNYPYGEHINYPDLQPLLSVGLRGLKLLGLPIAAHTVGATNLVALLGLALTPVVLYAILRRTRLPIIYSGVLALIIGFLSPQVERLGGHMSLSYSCFVPFLWYCLLRIQEAPRRWKWYALFGVSCLLMSGTSAYFLACGCIFALAHVLVISWQRGRTGPLLWRLTLAALLPLLIFRGWLWLTDPLTDRPTNPYGFLVYMATPASVFTPFLSPLRDAWASLFHTKQATHEGWAYVGLVGSGVLISGLVMAGRLAWRRQWRRLLRPALPPHLRVGLWASGLMLILAFGWPFTWHPLFEPLVDYAGPLKQFRALGRFAWPFFYVFSVFTAYYLYRMWRYLRQHGVPRFATSWLVLLLVFWAIESFLQVRTKAKAVALNTGASAFMTRENDELFKQLSWSNHRVSDFQAILSLPFFAVGTEKFALAASEASIHESFRLSLATGLPLIASEMARSSVGRAMEGLQLLSSDLIPKSLLAHFDSPKPLLLLVTNDALTPAEQRLVGLARKIVATPEATLYELPIAALAATSLEAERARAAALLAAPPTQPGGIRTTTGKAVILETFDQSPDRRGRLGAGAYYEPKDMFSILYDGPLAQPGDTGRYEASVWMNARMEHNLGNMQVKVFDAAGQLLDHQVADARFGTEILGEWQRVVVPFYRAPGATRVTVLYQTRDLLADDLLIRPLDTDVYYYAPPGSRNPVKNTYPLKQ